MFRQKYVSDANALSELGQKIFLDRYALKDGPKESLAEGDEVVVLLDSQTSQRELGIVREIKENSVIAELQDGTSVEVLRDQIDKPLEYTVEEMMDRVARGASAIEKSRVRKKYEKEFRWLLEGWKFIPGGRILSSCGTDQALSYYNCFVIPSPEDSRGGIMASLGHMAEIMSRGGGVGINLSSLRPHYAYVRGVNGRSSGSVSWGGLFSFVTGLIEQGGSRRGALMLILNVWHPDILEFIESKRTAGKITNANISVNISDDFMQAVEEDRDWDLIFPDTSDPLYCPENWNGNIKEWQRIGGRVIIHKTVKAREVWDRIIESAWASAEPGLWFGDRCATESNSWYYPEGNLYCTNPCVTGDTLILTNTGYVPIRDTIGKETRIWNGFEFSNVIPEKTGEKQDLVRVTFSNGKELRCTPYHKFILENNSRVEARRLQPGDILKKCFFPIINGEAMGDNLKEVSVTRIELLDEKEDVYCFTEPKNHSGIFNGILTAQCGEQPLPGWGVCNLGHVNLSKMYRDGDIDWETLGKTVKLAVRFLDNIIDITPYFFQQNRDQQAAERRIGLGTIGLAELLIRAGIRYGSEECEAFIDRLYRFIAVTAYETSCELAKEKGKFPKFDAEKVLQSGFMKRMPPELRDKIRECGLRNVTLLTQAPTGTVGTMAGTSTGIEPFYFWSYTRKSRLGSYTEKVSVLEEYEKEHPGEPLPAYFVNALDLTPEEHVRTQAAIQKWVDSAISKTCNVPSTYTVEQTRELYELMYKLGCKGGTIYRDKSRDEQVLTAQPKEEKPKSEKPKEMPKLRPRPVKRMGATVTKETPAGTCHVIMNDDTEGHPFEIFIEIGKGGSDIKAMAEALGRVASILLRISSPLTPEERIKEITKQLKGIGGQRSVGFGKSRIKSLPDAVAQALQENYSPGEAEDETEGMDIPQATGFDICPCCGNTSFLNIEGCSKCYSCGHSEC